MLKLARSFCLSCSLFNIVEAVFIDNGKPAFFYKAIDYGFLDSLSDLAGYIACPFKIINNDGFFFLFGHEKY